MLSTTPGESKCAIDISLHYGGNTVEGTSAHESVQKSLEGLWKNRLWTPSCRYLRGVVIWVCVCVCVGVCVHVHMLSLLVVSDSL